MQSTEILRTDRITKSFGGVKALDDVSIQVEKGEIHSIVGQNGAGKSTLMNILVGMISPDSGKVLFNNSEVAFKSPHEAQALGIGLVPQELYLVPSITAAENILLGTTTRKGMLRRVEWKRLYSDASQYIHMLNIDIDPGEITSHLSPAQQELIQIARILAWNCELLILDEPTGSLAEREVQNLFSILLELKKRHKTIIYICHKLEEVFEVSDRISVMRDGKLIATKSANETSRDEIVRLMIGRDLASQGRLQRATSFGATVLQVSNFSLKQKVNGVSFFVRKGEVIGLAGLVGAGRTELLNGVYGLLRKTDGDIYIEGIKVNVSNPRTAIKAGMALIPEERKSQAILPSMSLLSNISLPILDRLTSWLGLIHLKREKNLVKGRIRPLNIKTPSLEQKISNLSGGNQQKAIIARWMLGYCKLLLLDEPTRGIDVGAKEEIHGIIQRLAEEGLGMIVVSSELPELMALTDRIYTIRNGRITKELQTKDVSQEEVMNELLRAD